MTKILIISDKNFKSYKIKKNVLNILKNKRLNLPNLIIVIGGDGFMLQTLKKYKQSNKIFYGINSGNYGFLMNKFSKKKSLKKYNKIKNYLNFPTRNDS